MERCKEQRFRTRCGLRSQECSVLQHGEAIALFGIRDFDRHRALMERAYSLTQSGPIEFRLCRADAAMRGYRPADLHGFARMAPMADAEIVRLQNEGYAYLR